MKKKIYIAGKIGDQPIEVYTKNFNNAKQECIALGFHPILPIELDHSNSVLWEDYMKTDLKALLDCDAVFAMNDWSLSKGAAIEVSLAINLNILVLFQK